jgi:hypothetical protein
MMSVDAGDAPSCAADAAQSQILHEYGKRLYASCRWINSIL